jgi:hypothetical protein
MARGGDRGQATVELVALLPLVVVLAAGVWQLALCGHAVWAGGVAARAAARAEAVGADPRDAAVRRLPSSLRPGVEVRSVGSEGAVRVEVRIPAVVGSGLGSIGSTARFERQR